MHVLGEVHPAAVILVEHAVHGVTEDAALGAPAAQYLASIFTYSISIYHN